jgi:hypothetical protein
VQRRCKGTLKAVNWKGGNGANGIYWQAHSNNIKNAVFPAATASGIVGAAVSNLGSGGSTIRTQYALKFTGGTPTVSAAATFVVENGVLDESSIQFDCGGAYASAPVLDFGNATGLANVAATAVLGSIEDYSVSEGNDFMLEAYHANQPVGSNAIRYRQDTASNGGAGNRWSTLRAKVMVDAGAGAGFSDAGVATHHLHLADVEVIGPASGFAEFTATNPAIPGQGRLGNIRSSKVAGYPAGMGANWALDPWASPATVVRLVAP